MAVVSLVDRPQGLLRRLTWWASRRMFDGTVADPLRAQAHHGGVLVASGVLEAAVARGWRRLDPGLRWLAVQAVSGAIGCSWCTDYGYWEGMQHGVDPRKVRDVPRWRDSDAYDDRERLVLEYAEAVCATPAQLTDDLVARLRRTFTEPEIVELAGWVALENYRSRANAGLGLVSQGFSDRCALPGGG
jgi:alkylhydroperoxidase family enzyme